MASPICIFIGYDKRTVIPFNYSITLFVRETSDVLHSTFCEFNGCLQDGDESYESYRAERDGILSSLARRAKVSYLKNKMEKCELLQTTNMA